MFLETAAGEKFGVHQRGQADAERAILIIHDWWGVKPYNIDWAERFAGMGYRTLVVDLYDGYHPKDAHEAGEVMRNIDQDKVQRKLQSALVHLKAKQHRIAVLGWSFGGLQAQYASFLKPDAVTATIFFYCRILTEPEMIASLQGPVLGIFSETERTWPEKQEKWQAAMAAAGKSYESHSFAADHGFVNPESPRFDTAATERSWQLVVDFLKRKL